MLTLRQCIIMITTLAFHNQMCSAAYIPRVEKLCNFIVDLEAEKNCIKCFEDAGPVKDDPIGVRECVANHLPPMMAECAVPGLRKYTGYSGKQYVMGQEVPHVHISDLTANLLPNCLKRRIRRLGFYLKRENHFVSQTKRFLKLIVRNGQIPDGGAHMLNIAATRQLLSEPEIETLLMKNSHACDISATSSGRNMKMRSHNAAAFGFSNDLPVYGMGPIAEELFRGSCLLEHMLHSGDGNNILSYFASEDFYSPIPKNWVAALLDYAKSNPGPY